MTIIDGEGHETAARVAGRVYRDTTPVAGDRAVAVRTDNEPLVQRILPRTGILQRTSPLGREIQIIASNVDMVLAICSLRRPDFSHGFLSRALVAAAWRGLDATVVLNKVDLRPEGVDDTLLREILSVYGGSGYPVLQTSCITGAGIAGLLEHLRGHTAVMTGPSGAGKTSLVKRYVPSLDVRIGSLNPRTSRGRHTTVAARMIPLDGETFLIDTPGLKMFSIEHIPADEIQRCFPEFREYLGQCRFSDCLHHSEPGCAVKSAVNRGEISRIRYEMYTGLISSS